MQRSEHHAFVMVTPELAKLNKELGLSLLKVNLKFLGIFAVITKKTD